MHALLCKSEKKKKKYNNNKALVPHFFGVGYGEFIHNSVFMLALNLPQPPSFSGLRTGCEQHRQSLKKRTRTKTQSPCYANLNLWRMLLSYFIQNPHLISDNYVTIL